MNGWVNGWMEWVNEWMGEWMGRVNGCVDECTDGGLDGWMINAWLGECVRWSFVSSSLGLREINPRQRPPCL